MLNSFRYELDDPSTILVLNISGVIKTKRQKQKPLLAMSLDFAYELVEFTRYGSRVLSRERTCFRKAVRFSNRTPWWLVLVANNVFHVLRPVSQPLGNT